MRDVSKFKYYSWTKNGYNGHNLTINLDLDEKCAKADFTIRNGIRDLHLGHP